VSAVAVELTRSLIRLDTTGPAQSLSAEILATRLSSAGMQVRLEPLDRGRASLVASVGDLGDAPLLLSGHLDTVPVGSTPWTRDAFGGEIAEGRVFGRGASDMKSGVASLVVALERYLQRSRAARGVVLVLTAGEETGCEGALQLVRTGILPVGARLLVAEPTSNAMVPGHKGALWLRVTARGLSAHGSRPDLGSNAVTALARLAVALEDAGLPGTHPVMGSTTVNIGTFEGGTRVNLVPDHASMEIDIRTVPGVGSHEIIERIEALSGGECIVETLLDMPGVYTAPGSPFYDMVSEVVTGVTGRAERAAPATFFTDASVLVPALGSPDVLLLGPGDPKLAHVVDESCSVERIGEAVEIYERLLDRWTYSRD
jgi:succinyl-diaminopimelate desuccinylase